MSILLAELRPFCRKISLIGLVGPLVLAQDPGAPEMPVEPTTGKKAILLYTQDVGNSARPSERKQFIKLLVD